MNKYVVSVKVRNNDYITKIEIEGSLCAAEHYFLDRGYNSKSEYSVSAAMAYDINGMKTETFRADCMSCEWVSEEELLKIIEENNKRMFDIDQKREEVAMQMKKLDELAKMVEEAKKALADCRTELLRMENK